MLLLCSCHGLAMLLSCSCHALVILLPYSCHALAMLLPCSCHALAMLLPSPCHPLALVRVWSVAGCGSVRAARPLLPPALVSAGLRAFCPRGERPANGLGLFFPLPGVDPMLAVAVAVVVSRQ